jgi:hypothetical protein
MPPVSEHWPLDVGPDLDAHGVQATRFNVSPRSVEGFGAKTVAQKLELRGAHALSALPGDIGKNVVQVAIEFSTRSAAAEWIVMGSTHRQKCSPLFGRELPDCIPMDRAHLSRHRDHV